jgi:hypothetical protein
MTVPSDLKSIPRRMLPIWDKIVAVTDAVCDRHLNHEYRELGARDDGSYPHMATADLCRACGVSESTLHGKARTIEGALAVSSLDLRWTLPSLAERNPLTWMAEVNGLLVDLRCMPREVQEIAFAKGMIPRIPTEN